MKSLISLITLAVLALVFTPATFAEEDCTNVDDSGPGESPKVTGAPDADATTDAVKTGPQ